MIGKHGACHYDSQRIYQLDRVMRGFRFFRWVLSATLLSAVFSSSFATVFYSKEEAMKLAFGDQSSVEILSLFPTPEQVSQIEQLAKVKLESNLLSLYVGKKQGQVIGYAAIESHTVRTQPETLLLVLNPAGQLNSVYTLAFHEPPEYQAPERWFAQLLNRSLDKVSFDQDVQAVAGATLSSRAALNSARKVLAIYQVMLKDGKP